MVAVGEEIEEKERISAEMEDSIRLKVFSTKKMRAKETAHTA